MRPVWVDVSRVGSLQLEALKMGDESVLALLPPGSWGYIQTQREEVYQELMDRFEAELEKGTDFCIGERETRRLLDNYRLNAPFTKVVMDPVRDSETLDDGV